MRDLSVDRIEGMAQAAGVRMAPWQRTLVAALMNTRGAVIVLRPPEFGRRAKMGGSES